MQLVGTKRNATQAMPQYRQQSLSQLLDCEQLNSAQMLSEFLRNKMQKKNEVQQNDQTSNLIRLLQDKIGAQQESPLTELLK